MRRTTMIRELIATLAIPLAAAPARAPLLAQSTTRPAVVVEGFLSRARLDPSVGGGSRMEVQGVGGRVLASLAPLPADDESAGPARRLAVGVFATYAPHDDGRFAAVHYGAISDYHLLGAPLAGRFDPLLSLGAGAFRARRVVAGERELTLHCVRAMDFSSDPLPTNCFSGVPGRTQVTTNLALSPAAALRVWLLPGLAVRLDARDVVVYRGAPRHNLELATGVSFLR